MVTTGDYQAIEIWDYLSQKTLEGHKPNVSFSMYQPILSIIVIGSEGRDSLDHTFNYPLHRKCTTWQPAQTVELLSLNSVGASPEDPTPIPQPPHELGSTEIRHSPNGRFVNMVRMPSGRRKIENDRVPRSTLIGNPPGHLSKTV